MISDAGRAAEELRAVARELFLNYQVGRAIALEHIREVKRSHLARGSDFNQLKNLGSNFTL